jgi:dihydrofolate reductase
MRKILITMFMTLDGRALLPAYPPDPDEDSTEEDPMWKGRETSVDTVILGRKTYEGWAAFWPTLAENPEVPPWMQEFSRFANSVEKLVFSRTLATAEWGPSRIVRGDPAAEVRRLKGEEGRDIAICGGPQVAQLFLAEDLVDEVLLEVFPSIVGRGLPLFRATDEPLAEERIPVGAPGRRDFRLKTAKSMSSGTVFLHYERKVLR